jgi:hypothetical protein
VPTKPLESILYRELSRVQAKEIIEVASSLLQELVNYATNALARCATSATGGIDEDIAILALYRHITEMTDGVEVLISQASPNPAMPLVRSSFEALLSIEYILEEDQYYVHRAIAWLVGYVHQRLDLYERLDVSTAKGKQFRPLFDSGRIASNIRLPPLAEVQKAQANLRSFLSKSHIQPIEAEFRKHKRRPHWYQLFGGPSSLWALSRHLKRGAQYEVLYRYWSRAAHAEDLLTFIDTNAQGEQAIGRLRDPSRIQEVTRFTVGFMLNATRLVLGKFRPGEDLSRWYKREVRQRYHLISGRQSPNES